MSDPEFDEVERYDEETWEVSFGRLLKGKRSRKSVTTTRTVQSHTQHYEADSKKEKPKAMARHARKKGT